MTGGLASAAVCAALLVAGCGGEDAGGGEDAKGGEKPRLTVSAAASLKAAFESYGERFGAARARFSFAGRPSWPRRSARA